MLTGGRFWKFLLLTLCLVWGAFVSIQRFAVSAEISGLSGAALKEIRAAAISVGGKTSLGIGIRSAPSPIELRFEASSETEALTHLSKVARIRTVDGATPQLDNAKISDGYLVWRSELPDCEIEIVQTSFLRSVTVARPALNESSVNTISPDKSLTRLKSDSGRRRLFMNVPFTTKDVFFVTGDSSREIILEKIGVYWGALSVVEERVSAPLHKFNLSIPPERIAYTALTALGALARSLFGGIWIAVCFVLAGLPLVRLLGFRGAASEYVTLAYVFAMSVGLCVTVTFGLAGLSLGASATLFWFAGCCAGVCLVLCWWYCLGLAGIWLRVCSYCEQSDLLPLCAISICCAIMLFTPSALSPGAFFGHNYTDTYWYLNVATDLWSIAPNVFSPDLWKMQRLGDIASVVLARAISGDSTIQAYQDLAVAVTLSLPWGVHAIMVRLTKERDFALAASLVAGTSAAVMGLYTQCYLAQYLMTYFVLFGLLVGVVLLQSDLRAATRSTLGWILLYGAVLGAGFTLYPYVQMVPVAFVIALCIRQGGSFSSKLIIGVSLALATIVWSNASLQTVLGLGGNAQYSDALNGIARYHVFPFYESLEVFARALGLKDWVLNSQYLVEIAGTYGFVPSSHAQSLLEWVSIVLNWVGLLIFVAWALFAVSSILRRSVGVLLTCTFLLIALLSVLCLKAGQIYFYGKLLFSLGALLSCFTLLLVKSWPKVWRGLAVMLVTLNCAANFIDMMPLYLGRGAPIVGKMRTHSDVLDADMRAIRQAVMPQQDSAVSESKSGLVLVIGWWNGLQGTDKDRVALWYLREIFSGRRLLFTDAVSPGGGFWYGYESSLSTERLGQLLRSDDANYIFVCPGYEPSPELLRAYHLKLTNSWGSLYVPRQTGV